MVQVLALRDASERIEEVFPAAPLDLPNPLVFTNVEEFADERFTGFVLNGNRARTAQQRAVALCRYDRGTIVDGPNSYLVHTRRAFVREQLAPWITDLEVVERAALARAATAPTIAGECLLVARFGATTWGHWLLEILVKMVVAEALYPGRFAFLVPRGIIQPSRTRDYAAAVLETVDAYGIERHRLLGLARDAACQCEALFDFSDLWSDGIHPRAIECLRSSLKADVPGHLPRRVAFLRRNSEIRAVANRADLEPVLRGANFTSVDLLDTPFVEQIGIVRQGGPILGILGSGLANLVYAPSGTRILTMGPAGWYDDYFTSLLQRIGAYHADVRGISLLTVRNSVAYSPFYVNVLSLIRGMATLASPSVRITPEAGVRLAGRLVPRRFGAVVWERTFGLGGTFVPAEPDQWSGPEEGHTWSLGRTCRVSDPAFDLSAEDHWLEIEALGFVVLPHLRSRPLRVRVHDTQVFAADIGDLVHVHAFVDHRDFAHRTGIELVFEHPVCPSPKSMGVSEDDRPVGLGLRRVALRRVASAS